MKRLLIIFLLALAAAGCASIQSTAAPGTEVDAAYVAYVESAAKRFGTTVIWVNYPTRRADAAPVAR